MARLAAFDGWVTTGEEEWARPVLLERAEVLVRVELEAPTLAGRVRRTLRRIRSDVREPDLDWVDDVAVQRPGLEVVRLPDPHSADSWLRSFDEEFL
ncbi:hypothetical protein [Nocardioides humi]|uniref:hypothetical protein n=1 Tax=Nocardioides humi TaxID=449461 RepID=UPI0011296F93|nr:hypothetical protein [Nocardioides humi]